MNRHKKKITISFFTFVLVLVTVGQIFAHQPFLCFESVGYINYESDCNNSFFVIKSTTEQQENHKDDCTNCFDIPVWTYTSNVYLIQKSNSIQHNINSIQHYSLYNKSITSEIELDLIPNQSQTKTSYILSSLRSTILII
jgi:hypothetical protein